MQCRILSVAPGSSPLETIVELSSAAVIIFEHSFYVFEKRRYLKDRQRPVPSFIEALEQYMASPHAAAVREGVNTPVLTYREAVSTAVHAYQEAVSAAVYTSQGNSSTLMAKLPFEYFQRKAKRASERSQAEAKQAFHRSQEEAKQSVCSQAKAELLQRILDITLQHRL
ncbi:hypothetical protein DEU56DRAFT_825045, partial [Suillus clintonianus]|uniref:uncharacterized protein n=1 Tax=Suillus clintonianus TaxID=1904413 RepID=UPI001B85DC0B